MTHVCSSKEIHTICLLYVIVIFTLSAAKISITHSREVHLRLAIFFVRENCSAHTDSNLSVIMNSEEN
jgi:hypothetical protein